MKITVTYGQKRPGPDPYTTDDLHVTFEDECDEMESLHDQADNLFEVAKSWIEGRMPKYDKQAAPQPQPAAEPAPSQPQPAPQPQAPSQPAPQPAASGERGSWRDNFRRICTLVGVDYTDQMARKSLETHLIRHLSKWRTKEGEWVGNMATGYNDWLERGRNKNGDPQTDRSIASVNEGIVSVAKALEYDGRYTLSYNA